MNDETTWQSEYLAEYARTSGNTATLEPSTPRGRYWLRTGHHLHPNKYTRKEIVAMTARLRNRPSFEEQARLEAQRREALIDGPLSGLAGLAHVKDATGEFPVYPGHPLVVAFEIIKVFPSAEAALRTDGNEHGWPAALTDSRISGGGGEVHRGCDLIRQAVAGTPAAELIEWADKAWVDGGAGGHTKAVEPGLAQAAKLKGTFPELLQTWLSKGAAGAQPG